MTVAYVESSALVKLALAEDHSADLRAAIRGGDLVTSQLSALEVGRALWRSAAFTKEAASAVIDALEQMDLAYPEVDEAKKAELAKARAALEGEKA